MGGGGVGVDVSLEISGENALVVFSNSSTNSATDRGGGGVLVILYRVYG